MKKIIFLASALLTVFALGSQSQTATVQTGQKAKPAQQSRTFFPHNWVRGYTDFEVAPSHNEPDLGRCAFPQPASAGGAASLCTAYGRYLWSGYVEFQPIGRTPARHFFLFFEPKFTFGRNIPQLSYTASMLPMAFERSVGVGFKLPKNFELLRQIPRPRRPPHQWTLRSLCHCGCALVVRRIRNLIRLVGVLDRTFVNCHRAVLFFFVQLFGKAFELIAPIKFAHLLRIFSPIRSDFHE